jgi:hypothetical protein
VTRLRTLALGLLAATLPACATTLDPDLQRDDRCIYEIGRPHAIGGEYELYKAHRRVSDDNLIAATADVAQAHDFASRAQLDEWLAIGSLVLGPVLFVPGVGLFGYGVAKSENGTIAGGVVLGASGLAGIIAGGLLYVRAGRERERAIDAYNRERAASCRP